MLNLVFGNNHYLSWTQALKLTGGKYKLIDGQKLDSLDPLLEQVSNLAMFEMDNVPILVKRFFNNRKKSLHDQFIDIYVNDSGQPIVLWEEGEVDKRSKLYKYIKKNGVVEGFDLLKPAALVSWLESELKQRGVAIDRIYVEKLIDKVGTDQFSLANEIDKLELFLKSENREKVEAQDLEIVSYYEFEVNIWEMMDAISSRNTKQILILVNDLMKKPTDFPYVIAMMTKQLKILYLLKNPDITHEEIAKELRIHPYTLKKASAYLYKFELDKIKLLFEKLVNLDLAIKEGKIDPRLGVNLFVASI